jgi:thiol:disulfide interchange protein
MDSATNIREETSRVTPSTIIGFLLLGAGVYLIYFVLSELWVFVQDGEHRFISLIVSKLNAEDFLTFGGTDIALGSSAKFVLGSIVFLFMVSALAGIATTLVSAGTNLMSPQVASLKERVHALGARIHALEKEQKRDS